MIILKIVSLSIGSVAVLFILTKLMGQREMSQLSMFDYIVSITIGSIAAEMATSLEDNFLEPLIAMIAYAVITIIIAIISNKSLKLRTVLSGKNLVLYDNGTLFRENFKKAKIDLNEFLAQCRTNGYFSLSDIQTALLEENGKISFLPISGKRPVNPNDLNILPEKSTLDINLILDGRIIMQNLNKLGHDEPWIYEQLQKQGITKIDNIFLCVYNNGSISAYLR